MNIKGKMVRITLLSIVTLLILATCSGEDTDAVLYRAAQRNGISARSPFYSPANAVGNSEHIYISPISLMNITGGEPTPDDTLVLQFSYIYTNYSDTVQEYIESTLRIPVTMDEEHHYHLINWVP